MFDDFFALSALSRGTISTSFVGPREVTRGAEGGMSLFLCGIHTYFSCILFFFKILSEGTEYLDSKINSAVVWRKA